MKTLRTFTVGLAAMALLSFTNAQASFVASWAQQWNESNVGTFTQIDVYLRSGNGVALEAPGLRSFTLGSGWTSVMTTPSLAIARGPSLSNLNFKTAFTSEDIVPLSIDLYAWDGITLRNSVRASWSGSTWSFGASAVEAGPAVVPEPTTLIASALLLLLPFGSMTLRFFRNHTQRRLL